MRNDMRILSAETMEELDRQICECDDSWSLFSLNVVNDPASVSGFRFFLMAVQFKPIQTTVAAIPSSAVVPAIPNVTDPEAIEIISDLMAMMNTSPEFRKVYKESLAHLTEESDPVQRGGTR